jgi:hypothetical protein
VYVCLCDCLACRNVFVYGPKLNRFIPISGRQINESGIAIFLPKSPEAEILQLTNF